jgi:hypothetical protein
LKGNNLDKEVEDIETILAQIKQKRLRQLSLGYDAQHDDEHVAGEIALAAGCYAVKAGLLSKHYTDFWDQFSHEEDISVLSNFFWPWPESLVLLEDLPKEGCLLRAAALIVAELQRINRGKGAEHGGPST